jgi:hypothetical protein
MPLNCSRESITEWNRGEGGGKGGLMIELGNQQKPRSGTANPLYGTLLISLSRCAVAIGYIANRSYSASVASASSGGGEAKGRAASIAALTFAFCEEPFSVQQLLM